MVWLDLDSDAEGLATSAIAGRGAAAGVDERLDVCGELGVLSFGHGGHTAAPVRNHRRHSGVAGARAGGAGGHTRHVKGLRVSGVRI